MNISGSPFRNMADIVVFSILFLEDAGMNEPLPASWNYQGKEMRTMAEIPTSSNLATHF